MNEGGPISEFFFNLIPGSLFLFFLNLLANNQLLKPLIKLDQEVLLISFYIVGGLSVGFFFQCLTKIIREHANSWAFKSILNRSENKPKVEKIEKELKMEGGQIFFYMDNSIRGITPAFLPTHFSSRFSFWSNISWGCLFLAIASVSVQNIHSLILFLLLMVFSIWMAKLHLLNYYDTVFKTYYMTKVHQGLSNN